MLALLGESEEQARLKAQLTKCEEEVEQLRRKLGEMTASDKSSLIEHYAARMTADDQSPEEKRYYQSPKLPQLRSKYQCKGTLRRISDLKISKDPRNSLVLAVSRNGTEVYDFHSGHLIKCLSNGADGTEGGDISEDGTMVATGTDTRRILIFRLSELEMEGPHDHSGEIRDHMHDFRSMDMMDSQGCTMITTDDGYDLITWDLSRCSQISQQSEVTSTVYSSDFNLKTGLLITGEDSGRVRVWDPRSDDPCVCAFYLMEPNLDIHSVRWFPDGWSVLAGDDHGTVRLFDMRSRKQLSEYDAPNSRLTTVSSLDVSNTGRYVIAGYLDDIDARLFDTLEGTENQKLRNYHAFVHVLFSFDGQSIIGAFEGIHVWG